jgi:proline iminopeptidase
MKQLLFLALLFVFVGNANGQSKDSIYSANLNSAEVKFITIRNGKYKVWTRKVGNGSIKILLLHGGPGTSPEYFENFPSYLKDNYTIYFYSQLGSFLSDQPTDTTLADVQKFAEDVEEVRKGLGLDSFYLLGHSWGSFLGQVYAAKYQKQLKGLILCNADIYSRGKNQEYQGELIANIVESIPDYKKYADSIRYDFIDNITNPDLMGKILEIAFPMFIRQHYCRLDSLPEPLLRSKIHSTGSTNKVSEYLTYKMNQFDFEPYLKKISVPVLFIGSKYDFEPPWDYIKMKNAMNNKKVDIYICPNGSHFDMWDDSNNFFEAIKAFIFKTEK